MIVDPPWRRTRDAYVLNLAGVDYTTPIGDGAPLAIICGAKWDYRRNDQEHMHYVFYERNIYEYDGRYLQPIGAKRP